VKLIVIQIHALLLLCASFAASAYSQSASSASQPVTLASVDPGDVSHNAYHNLQLGFTYDYPSIADGNQLAWADDLDPKYKKSDAPRCSKTLFMATEHPLNMEMNDNRFNSSVLLLAGSPECLNAPFPSSEDDKAAIQKIAGSIGLYFKTIGAHANGSVRIRTFQYSGRIILEVSQPYSLLKQGGGSSITHLVYTSVLITKARDLWLMWMYASSEPAEMEKLRATKLFFEAPPD
jgi:hypothetical protein